MSHALLFATEASADGGASALLPISGSTVVESLVGTLRSLAVHRITVVARPDWAADLRQRGLDVVESKDVAGDLATVAAAATSTSGPLILIAADLVAHRAALAKFAGVRVAGTRAGITVAAGADATAQPILRQRDQVISVGTHAHDVTGPNALFRALLTVGYSDLPALAEVCASVTEQIDDLDAAAGTYGPIGLVLLGLVRSDVRVPAYHVRLLHVNRVATGVAAKAAHDGLPSVDEPAAALRAAVKEDDDLFATVAVHPITPRFVATFAKLGISSNAVTWFSIVVAAGAAVSFGVGARPYWILGAALLYLAFVLDCCDGELARFTGRTSRYGGWFDMIADRSKEYGVYAGLAVGGTRAGERGVWALALAAICLQTVRHLIDTWYGALQEQATRSMAPVPLASRLDALGLRAAARGEDGAAQRIGATLGRLSASATSERHSIKYWLKRTVVLPIGERWLLIALVTAVFNPKIAFSALLVCGVLAFGYVLAGRSLRALSMRVAVMPVYDIPLQRDDGLLARTLGGRGGALVSTLPAIVAALIALGFGVAGTPDTGRVLVTCALGVLGLVAIAGARAAHDRAFDWLVPAALRALEYTFVLAAGVYGGVPHPLMYALLAVLVLMHYDNASRIEKAATPLRLTRTALGWDVRIVVLAILTALGYATAGFIALTAVVALTLIVGYTMGLSHRVAT